LPGGRPSGDARKADKGAEVDYGIFATVLGPMLVAGTIHGVSHVAFGDDSAQLEQDLHEASAPATARRDDARVASWAKAISAQLEGKARTIDVPVDVAGTPFQQRVWTELRHIPFGELRSYQELAIMVGQPTAARAVASACARNKVAVVIPCHRVVRGTGELGGYRWGVERKQQLIDAERGTA
jgi:AraC family transcriptional regulator of adaptative response/methylated-DNA-[protein]-cysteine methyltransferase